MVPVRVHFLVLLLLSAAGGCDLQQPGGGLGELAENCALQDGLGSRV